MIKELLPSAWPANERSVPAEARERELAERNAAALHHWYVATYGPTVGRVLFEETRRARS